ncbi:MAG: zinc carboxypeptidase [Deltaproteobacteria bacterium]|nr:zinc carboxypeptidase [Deltaproteobacteria bacterium]MBI3388942.1 zinc carboxypeptidase [Deltaproteobacteria bacterium]
MRSIWLLVLALSIAPGVFAQSYVADERLRANRLATLKEQLGNRTDATFTQALDALVASDAPGTLDVWEHALATTDGARRPELLRRFAAVRDRLTRRERIARVVRLATSRAQLARVQQALEEQGGPLNLTLWHTDGDHVVVALSPAAYERLAAAGIAGDVLFNSVSEWQHAQRRGAATAVRIMPHYQSNAAANDHRARILVFDLAAGPVDAAQYLLADHENVVARNDRYLAYLDIVPRHHRHIYLRQRYRQHGLRIVAMLPVDRFDTAGRRFFPELEGSALTIGSAASLDGQFHSYAEVAAELQDLAARYPGIASLSSLGPTYEGREIWALKISRDVTVDDPNKPDVLFTGCHHAREWISVEPPMYFAHRLLDDYATDDSVRYFVDHAEIWIVPIVNPDGLAYSQRSANSAGDSVRYWRKNRRPIRTASCGSGVGVDLNRNYNFMWRLASDRPCPTTFDDQGASDDPGDFQLYRGPSPLSELEVQAIAALTANPAHNFISRVDFHNYSQLVLYPWDFGTSPSADANTQAQLGAMLAQRLSATNGVHYTPEPGVGLYIATGTSVDHAYGVDHTVAAFVWELRPASCCFYVPENQIDPINRESWNGARALLDWSVGPPYLVDVEARQQSAGAAFDAVVYQAGWSDAVNGRTLSVANLAGQLQPGRLRLTLHFSKPMPAGSSPQVTLGRIAPFNEVTATVVAPGEGWQTTLGNDTNNTWIGEVDIPAYGDGTLPWQLAVRVQDGVGSALDAQPATIANYGFGSDHWLDDESGSDLQHLLPTSVSLGPLPSATATTTRVPTPTRTPTRTRSASPTRTATRTRRPTITLTPTWTRRPTRTPTATRTRTSTATRTPSATPTSTRRPTRTRTPL